jgi:hypothetical protein
MNINNENQNEDQKNAIGMASALLNNSKDINNTLTVSKITRSIFHTHYANMETSEFGIGDLICKILRSNDACFSLAIETSELRNIAIAGSMFTEQILEKVKEIFTAGSIRYPEKTVRATLSVTLFKLKKIGKIQLTNKEDEERECCKPRCKWYLAV